MTIRSSSWQQRPKPTPSILLRRAILAAARERGALPKATGFQVDGGRGVEAEVDGRTVAVGGPNLLRDRGLSVPGRYWKRPGYLARSRSRGPIRRLGWRGHRSTFSGRRDQARIEGGSQRTSCVSGSKWR